MSLNNDGSEAHLMKTTANLVRSILCEAYREKCKSFGLKTELVLVVQYIYRYIFPFRAFGSPQGCIKVSKIGSPQ